MRLVIVESPNKQAKLQVYADAVFGPGAVRVFATAGHWRGLPPMKDRNFSDIVDVTTWRESFVVLKDNIAQQLRRHIDAASEVFLATDADREGEGIAWHILDVFNPRVARRIVFKEITKTAFKQAFDTATDLDLNLADAQRCRQILDYEIGMEVSRRIWRFGCQSAGRVQSATLRILVDREHAIDAFKPEAFWTISATYDGDFVAQVATFEAPTAEELDEGGDDKDKATLKLAPKRFSSEAEALSMVEAARGRRHVVESLDIKPTKRRPKPPFTTADLQAEASTKLSWDPEKTAAVAQRLFEEGLVTYIRTDSVSLSQDATDDIRAYLGQRSPHLLPSTPQVYSDGSAAQAAHEAIRPVLMVNPEADKLERASDDERLYSLIWQRTLACQAKDAELQVSVVTIAPGGLPWRLIARGSILLVPGFLSLTKPEPAAGEVALPVIDKGQHLKLIKLEAKGGKTTPPLRFTAASLTKYLERKGIGRPSTYATILKTLKDRSYVKEAKRRLVPDEQGFLCDRLTRLGFDQLTRETFTAVTEKSLDRVAAGKLTRQAFLDSFQAAFVAMLTSSAANFADYAIRHPELDRESSVPHDQPCKVCGAEMLRRRGKHGAYAQCGAESCGAKVNLDPLKELKEPCPDCGGVVVEQPFMKEGKRQTYYRCLNGDWKSSFKPPKPTKTRCHVDAAHGFINEVTKKNRETKESFKLFVCPKCQHTSKTEKAPPPCPLCAAGMALLMNRTTQEPFWGCSMFRTTQCKGFLAVEAAPEKKKKRRVPS